jgi:hypothetical protein
MHFIFHLIISKNDDMHLYDHSLLKSKIASLYDSMLDRETFHLRLQYIKNMFSKDII